MLFDEVTKQNRPLSILEIKDKLENFLDYMHPYTEIIFDFEKYPKDFMKSDYEGEFFLNYSNRKNKLKKIIKQLETLEEDLQITNDFTHYDTEVLVGMGDEENDFMNFLVTDIIEEDGKIIIKTEEA